MQTRFIETAWVEGAIDELPVAWLPSENPRSRGVADTEGEAATAALYTVLPNDSSESVLFDPFLRLRLADGGAISILIHDSLDIAVLEV